MRLIDADALINNIIDKQNTVCGHHDQLEILSIMNRYVVNMIQNAPTVELIDKKHKVKTYLDTYKEEHGCEPRAVGGAFMACPEMGMDCPHDSDGYVISCAECWNSAYGKWRDEVNKCD